MQAQPAYVVRSRKSEERELAPRTLMQPPPHKERALWNFLTWSFFIAQVLAAEQFIGAQAKAAEGLDLRSSDPSTPLATAHSSTLALADSAVSSSDDVHPSLGGSLDDKPFQSLKLGHFGDSVIDLDSISVVPTEHASQFISVSGRAGGFSPSEDTPNGLLPEPGVAIVLPDVPEILGGVTGPLLDTVEDIVTVLTGIVGGISHPLLGMVGGVVQAVDDVVHDALTPVTDLVGDLAQPVGGVLASAGQIVLPVLHRAGLDDLYTDGRYTDYGIELQARASLPGEAIGAITSVAETATEAVDHIVDVATPPLNDVGRDIANLLDDVTSGSLVDRLL